MIGPRVMETMRLLCPIMKELDQPWGGANVSSVTGEIILAWYFFRRLME
jgi:hypothetical protein